MSDRRRPLPSRAHTYPYPHSPPSYHRSTSSPASPRSRGLVQTPSSSSTPPLDLEEQVKRLKHSPERSSRLTGPPLYAADMVWASSSDSDSSREKKRREGGKIDSDEDTGSDRTVTPDLYKSLPALPDDHQNSFLSMSPPVTTAEVDPVLEEGLPPPTTPPRGTEGYAPTRSPPSPSPSRICKPGGPLSRRHNQRPQSLGDSLMSDNRPSPQYDIAHYFSSSRPPSQASVSGMAASAFRISVEQRSRRTISLSTLAEAMSGNKRPRREYVEWELKLPPEGSDKPPTPPPRTQPIRHRHTQSVPDQALHGIEIPTLPRLSETSLSGRHWPARDIRGKLTIMSDDETHSPARTFQARPHTGSDTARVRETSSTDAPKASSPQGSTTTPARMSSSVAESSPPVPDLSPASPGSPKRQRERIMSQRERGNDFVPGRDTDLKSQGHLYRRSQEKLAVDRHDDLMHVTPTTPPLNVPKRKDKGKGKARALPSDFSDQASFDPVQADLSRTLAALDDEQMSIAVDLSRMDQARQRGEYFSRSLDRELRQRATELQMRAEVARAVIALPPPQAISGSQTGLARSNVSPETTSYELNTDQDSHQREYTEPFVPSSPLSPDQFFVGEPGDALSTPKRVREISAETRLELFPAIQVPHDRPAGDFTGTSRSHTMFRENSRSSPPTALDQRPFIHEEDMDDPFANWQVSFFEEDEPPPMPLPFRSTEVEFNLIGATPETQDIPTFSDEIEVEDLAPDFRFPRSSATPEFTVPSLDNERLADPGLGGGWRTSARRRASWAVAEGSFSSAITLLPSSLAVQIDDTDRIAEGGDTLSPLPARRPSLRRGGTTVLDIHDGRRMSLGDQLPSYSPAVVDGSRYSTAYPASFRATAVAANVLADIASNAVLRRRQGDISRRLEFSVPLPKYQETEPIEMTDLSSPAIISEGGSNRHYLSQHDVDGPLGSGCTTPRALQAGDDQAQDPVGGENPNSLLSETTQDASLETHAVHATPQATRTPIITLNISPSPPSTVEAITPRPFRTEDEDSPSMNLTHKSEESSPGAALIYPPRLRVPKRSDRSGERQAAGLQRRLSDIMTARSVGLDEEVESPPVPLDDPVGGLPGERRLSSFSKPRSAPRPPSGEIPASAMDPSIWIDRFGEIRTMLHQSPEPAPLGVIMEELDRRENRKAASTSATTAVEVPAIIYAAEQSAVSTLPAVQLPPPVHIPAAAHLGGISPNSPGLRSPVDHPYSFQDELPWPISRFSAYSTNTNVIMPTSPHGFVGRMFGQEHGGTESEYGRAGLVSVVVVPLTIVNRWFWGVVGMFSGRTGRRASRSESAVV